MVSKIVVQNLNYNVNTGLVKFFVKEKARVTLSVDAHETWITEHSETITLLGSPTH